MIYTKTRGGEGGVDGEDVSTLGKMTNEYDPYIIAEYRWFRSAEDRERKIH